jgi:hypothetical protein
MHEAYMIEPIGPQSIDKAYPLAKNYRPGNAAEGMVEVLPIPRLVAR